MEDTFVMDATQWISDPPPKKKKTQQKQQKNPKLDFHQRIHSQGVEHDDPKGQRQPKLFERLSVRC